MKNWKWIQALALSLMVVMVVTACGNNAGGSNEKETNKESAVKITLLNSKGEIQTQLEDAAKAFKEDYPNITLEIIPVPGGQSPFEKASALYASGNPATITMLDTGDVEKFKDRVLI